MLFRKFDFDNPSAQRYFKFDRKKHTSTWEHYYSCYNYAIKKIFEKGLQRNYAFNCRARSLLFLIRHSFELCLKFHLDLNEITVPNSHVFEELISAFGDTDVIPEDFKKLIEKIDFDSDGTCFRYYRNEGNGEPYFTLKDRIEIADLIKDYNNLPASENFKKGDIAESFDYSNRKIQWDLTFHMGECNGLGTIRTQYDDVIEFLIEGVLFENYEINRVYLPLLFLIRHSLELALKVNIHEAKKVSTKVPDKDYGSIHSLAQLYNCFGGENGYLSKLDLTKMSTETKAKYDAYKLQYEELNSVIHTLDSNSMYFRYPVDKKSNAHPLYLSYDGIYEILKLYYLTDPFITFTNAVLEDEGITD